ncbi:hypothetical protein DMUE_6363, partial [Dictyocoela muelleri]
EHRIESWYHHYPFIVSDDLRQTFESKQNQLTVSAYFIDESPQTFHSNLKTKTYLQGKPFHINDDWKRFDLILISDQIYDEIIFPLQKIFNLIRAAGKIIPIQQINHEQDLKTQIRSICRQFHQRI